MYHVLTKTPAFLIVKQAGSRRLPDCRELASLRRRSGAFVSYSEARRKVEHTCSLVRCSCFGRRKCQNPGITGASSMSWARLLPTHSGSAVARLVAPLWSNRSPKGFRLRWAISGVVGPCATVVQMRGSCKGFSINFLAFPWPRGGCAKEDTWFSRSYACIYILACLAPFVPVVARPVAPSCR